MSKPPKETPHSDLDGVREDRRDNVSDALRSGQDARDLARARDKSVGRPPSSDDKPQDR